VHIVAVDQLNTYDVLAAEDVVFTKGAYEVFTGRPVAEAGQQAAEKPAAEKVEKPAAEEPAAEKVEKTETAEETDK
jgi:large subunit ribosomal protein L4